MANFTSAKDLVEYVLDRAGEPTDGNSDFDAQALEELNRAYQAIVDGGQELDPDINEVWWWARSATPGTITLQAAIETGTIAVANDSTAVTFSSAPAVSVAGWHFKADGHADVFRVSTHTAATTGAVLDSVYTGDTDAAVAYRVAKLEYDLDPSDFRSMVSPMRVYQDNRFRINGMEAEALDSEWPLDLQQKGIPRAFAMVGETKVRFSHYVDTLVRLDYPYVVEPADLIDDASSIPIVPRQYRHMLADFALALLYEQKDDDRSAARLAAAQAGIRAMFREQRTRMLRQSDGIGVIRPRLRGRMSRGRPLLRTVGGHIIG